MSINIDSSIKILNLIKILFNPSILLTNEFFWVNARDAIADGIVRLPMVSFTELVVQPIRSFKKSEITTILRTFASVG